MSESKYGWRQLLGRRVVTSNNEGGTLELTTESSIRRGAPFCVMDEDKNAIMYFGEGVVKDAYNGNSATLQFVDGSGEKIMNFL